MTDRPSWAPPGIDLTVPSVSRVYDYFLGGSHNFEVDREAGRKIVEAVPGTRKAAQANRATMRRVVRYATDLGISQFLDIGSGIPTFGNVHEVVQALDPGANVVYVDNDPVAVAHSKAVLEGNEHAGIVAADLRDPRSFLDHPATRRLLDLDRPVALLLMAVLHFLTDEDGAYDVVTELRDALAPGSLLLVTHGAPTDSVSRAIAKVYEDTHITVALRDKAQTERFFTGFELVEPGVVALPYWRPDTDPGDDPEASEIGALAGVGLKA